MARFMRKASAAGRLRARTIAAILRVIASMLALVMLVSLPAGRQHSFTTHVREPLVRRSTQRHTFVTPAEASAAEQVQRSTPAPSCFDSIESAEAIRPLLQLELKTEDALARLLYRLKLGVSRKTSLDPL